MGEPILTDFGIAKLLGHAHTIPGNRLIGTPLYTSPEQAMGLPGDGRSDLYSLGVVLYELCTGVLPFNGDNAAVVLAQHVYATPVKPGHINPNIAPALNDVILRCMAREPAERFPDAASMAIALTEALNKDVPEDLSEAGGGKVVLAEAAKFPLPEKLLAIKSPLPLRVSVFKNNFGIILSLIVMMLLIIIGLLPLLHPLSHTNTTTSPDQTITLPAGIGVAQAPGGESIGVSDGSFAFDTQRLDGSLKQQAARYLRENVLDKSMSLWVEATTLDTNDAEALIYREDQEVLDSGSPYITIVVGTTLTGNAETIVTGHECLQAAYVAQEEYNNGAILPGGMKVRMLIANSGSRETYATLVAQQVARLAQTDKTIVGVMGWTTSARELDAVRALSGARLPMVTDAGGDSLTNISPYFFRVVPPASEQGKVGAHYAERTLHARTAVLFMDVKDDFIRSQGNTFKNTFTGDGNTVVATENYTKGDQAQIARLTRDALSKHPDMIYFAGFPIDVGVVLAHMPTSGPLVMGGSPFYHLGSYPLDALKNLPHLRFTALAYADEWKALGLASNSPPFFNDYKMDFNPFGQHLSSPDGYSRPDGITMELYDAISVLLDGCKTALMQKPSLTGPDLQRALANIAGPMAFVGISGQISFGSDGNPVDKQITVICVDQQNRFKLDEVDGQFSIGGADFIHFGACG
jgi:ABC-type branched-subunit amino acid transport system substrate-binding protein